MQMLLNVICSVTAFSVLAAVIISLIPNESKLKKPLTVLSGLIFVLILLPLFRINVTDLNFNISEQSKYSSKIDSYLLDKISEPVKNDIINKSKPILNKYGVENVSVSFDAEFLDERGIFVSSVNYIIHESLSGSESLERELSEVTGYICTVKCGEAQ